MPIRREHGSRTACRRRRAASQAKHPHCVSPQRRCASLNIPGWMRTPGTPPDRARRCHGSPPQPGFRGGSRLRGARRLAQPLNGSILVRRRGCKAHGGSDAESEICATAGCQGPTLERGMGQARDAQTVTKAPYASLRSGQSRARRGATRSAFSRHSCANDCPASARMARKDARPHTQCRVPSRCPARDAANAEAHTPRHAGYRACTRLPRNATRAIVFRYPCNLFAGPNFFVRT